MKIPDWGAWSNRTAGIQKKSWSDYRYIRIEDDGGFNHLYGDFYFNGERRSNGYFNLSEGQDSRIYYLDGYKTKGWWISARICGGNFEAGRTVKYRWTPTK